MDRIALRYDAKFKPRVCKIKYGGLSFLSEK